MQRLGISQTDFLFFYEVVRCNFYIYKRHPTIKFGLRTIKEPKKKVLRKTYPLNNDLIMRRIKEKDYYMLKFLLSIFNHYRSVYE